MDMTTFIEAAKFSYYHGSDIALRVLSRMLKIPIAAWNSHFIWVSAPYISVYECPVLLVMDCVGNFHARGDHDNWLIIKLCTTINVPKINFNEMCLIIAAPLDDTASKPMPFQDQVSYSVKSAASAPIPS